MLFGSAKSGAVFFRKSLKLYEYTAMAFAGKAVCLEIVEDTLRLL
jgi:hypothetical protein